MAQMIGFNKSFVYPFNGAKVTVFGKLAGADNTILVFMDRKLHRYCTTCEFVYDKKAPCCPKCGGGQIDLESLAEAD